MTKRETDQSKLKRMNLIFPFVIPFVVVGSIWTIWDYCDISDGLEKGRSGSDLQITEQQIFLDSFKNTFLFAIPAGLIGLGCGCAVFGKPTKNDCSGPC